MNLRGSWRRLQGNAVSAILGAIEIYNKPRFAYRDEVFVILLINSWELMLKAIVSKAGKRIYYPKKRGIPYRTLSWQDAYWRAANSDHWPKEIERAAVFANLEVLSVYRDSAVHFYNNAHFGSIIYSLAQTSITNFRDLAVAVFGKDIAEEISWRILPLGVDSPLDPLTYMKGRDGTSSRSRAVQDFLEFLREKTDELDSAGVSTARLCTVFDVSLNSIKKIEKADIVVGIGSDDLAEAYVVQRRMDPNVSHPYRRKDILPRLKVSITPYEFDAIVRWAGLIDDPRYCWRDSEVSLVKWSPDVVRYLDSLTPDDISAARKSYASSQRTAAQRRRS